MPPMDAKIEALLNQKLCEHCRPLLTKILDYDRALAAARTAREALLDASKPAFVEDDSDGDEPDVSRADAFAAARRKAGLAEREPETRQANKLGANNPAWKDNLTEADVIRCVRGDVHPRQLAKQNSVDVSTVYARVRTMIGPPGEHDGRWRPGFGFTRNGGRAVDMLGKAHAVSHAPAAVARDTPAQVIRNRKRPLDADLQRVVDGRMGVAQLARKTHSTDATVYKYLKAYRDGARAPADADAEPAAPPERLTKFGRAPLVIADSELQRVVDGRLSIQQLATKLKTSYTTVAKRLVDYRGRLAKQPRQRTSAGSAPAPTPMSVAVDNITDEELDQVVDGKLSVTLLAHRHRVSGEAVSARVRDYKEENASVDRVLNTVSPAAVVASAGTMANGGGATQLPLNAESIVQRVIGKQ